LEAVASATFLNPKNDEVVIATKNDRVHRAVCDDKPQKDCATILGQIKRLLKPYISIVKIDKEEAEQHFYDLRETAEGAFNAENFMAQGGTAEQLDTKIREERMRCIRVNKYLESGARCSRAHSKQPSK
jgi:hypothetical protein